ncbi:MAG: undecaprenyldiphospho-muramoylpentapeptide beta-N-acetylglucosaminyltransferase [Sphingomonadales bacterium]|nr:undecaprenyldiphospho-muramoylpentapeptide beta-N-acetylglucosaminyltransferase [Sphingomonadales bacterium]MBK6492784.1 undecaprenyldiphospho-muramoylpentapeptide beta-N-acetylglucosaminyltransferase [Sphingomonadales bacterium]MBK6720345.1 undecaprenyldiphospho-muramoylpentapeptide beta-N-acetylglucosaminyltransferase [Sphingomonadales bacterium]MBK8272840.1 undecaprenyldiphospho-muramoylpentapeptide beta-N-acetylglucosaminyltransferase [Sphingomonadales bacterium]MBK8861745.1 undecaprenyl
MSVSRHFVLAAGGTGGHMMPAHALAAELVARGHHVALVTDERGARIPGLFEDVPVHILPAGRITGNPLSWPGGLRSIWSGRRMALRLYDAFEPAAVIGFGGYPAFPALSAAHSAGIPTAVHEQNAVLGRVNRLVANRVQAIATAYPDIKRIAARNLVKVHLVGNPVREDVLALRERPYPLLDAEGVFRVLVIGGSQGATILSDIVPDGLAMLPEALRRRLQVTQQCRVEDIDAVRARYQKLGIPADLATYMTDIPERLAWTHLVIGRAGASTIAELTAAGRPAILIPLPSATDDHQTENVREMVAAGGARAIRQDRFTPVELAKQMQKLGLDPQGLTNAARAAHNCGRPRATADLADLVESLGRTPVVDGLRADDWAPSPRLVGATA